MYIYTHTFNIHGVCIYIFNKAVSSLPPLLFLIQKLLLSLSHAVAKQHHNKK